MSETEQQHCFESKNKMYKLVHTWVRHLSLRHNLLQQDAIRPHIWLDGELAVQCCFWGSPLYGELRTYEHREMKTVKKDLWSEPWYNAKICGNCPLHRTQQLSWICYKWLHYSSFSILLKIKFLTQFKIWSFVCVSGLVSMQFGFSNRCIWNKCAYFAFSFQPSPSSYRCWKYVASAQSSAAVYNCA